MKPPEKIAICCGDQFTLQAILYRADCYQASCVILASGTGIAQNFYKPLALFLQKQGFHVLTLDYRGIGASQPPSLQGFKASMSDWGEKDLTALIEWAARQLKPQRLFFIGHSAGGQIVGLAKNFQNLDALVLVAAQSGYWKHWPLSQRYRFALLWNFIMPALTKFCGYFPSRRFKLGENLPREVALQWAAWCRHPDYLFGENPKHYPTQHHLFKGPILAYSFSDDNYAPLKAVEALLKHFPPKKIKHLHFNPQELSCQSIGHFGFFKEKFRDSLWTETVLWLKNIEKTGEKKGV